MKLFSKLFSLLLLVSATLFIQSCDSNTTGPDYSAAPPPFDTTQAVRDTTLAGDVKIYVIKEGSGPFKVVSRDHLVVRFTARTTKGRIFDSTYINKDNPEQAGTFYNLTPAPIVDPNGNARQPLVEGLRKGVLGMKEGEKRTVIIPPDMGFNGSQSSTSNSNLQGKTLIYDVELVQILDITT